MTIKFGLFLLISLILTVSISGCLGDGTKITDKITIKDKMIVQRTNYLLTTDQEVFSVSDKNFVKAEINHTYMVIYYDSQLFHDTAPYLLDLKEIVDS